MHAISTKTGPFLHAADDLYRIGFQTGGTPRSFTILLAQGRDGVRLDAYQSGLAVIDDDSGTVMLDEHLCDDPHAAATAVAHIRSMSWPEFAAFIHAHPRYRQTSGDINTLRPTPYPGNRGVQERLGHARGSIDHLDLRSELMLRANDDPQCAYNFPRITNAQAVNELCLTASTYCADGRLRFGWALPMDQLRAPHFEGFGDGAGEDAQWADYQDDYPELSHEVLDQILTPFFAMGVSTWAAQDAGRYCFSPARQDGSEVVLTSVDGKPLSFASPREVAVYLSGLSDFELRDLWKLKQTIDHELSPNLLKAKFEAVMSEHRLQAVTAPEDREIGHEL